MVKLCVISSFGVGPKTHDECVKINLEVINIQD
jgi:hypothetical protein